MIRTAVVRHIEGTLRDRTVRRVGRAGDAGSGPVQSNLDPQGMLDIFLEYQVRTNHAVDQLTFTMKTS